MSEATVMLDGLGFPESLRWRSGRLWFCNWGSGEVLSLAPGGSPESMERLEPGTLPLSIDWQPDGRLLIVDGPNRRLLCRDAGGELRIRADLSALTAKPYNELVVDAAGNAYVNGGPGDVVLVRPDGGTQIAASGLQWPNGMAFVDGGRTLVVADSHAVQLVAFDVAGDGTLAGRRTWADLEHAPDGICADAEGAVWVASVPGKCCTRIKEGGSVLESVGVDRGCFSCTLGGAHGRTLFIGAAFWRGMEAAVTDGPGRTGQVLSALVP